ncbi:hybrid sensor histidine kinase/response regulator [Dyadobacter bucti]|uniref:hybrid sensor histidine kinase/response regulator n=1 Tax=Dyadobacter bucti TaxID=2572203 RepID=UPI0011096CFA|nr:ATP-binding protein [Dyadobacter bucti]
MKSSSPVAPRAAFAWTAVLTVLLASFAFVILLTNSKSQTIKSNIHTLQQENAAYRKIDTCISILYSAENNSRLFVVTLDSAYLRSYSDQLMAVNRILHEYETERAHKSLTNLMSRKQLKNEEFIRLKTMVDSLLSFSWESQATASPIMAEPVRKLTVTREAHNTDTIEVTVQKRKRGLMKRIIDAIRDKDTLSNAVARTKSTATVSHDSVNLPLPTALLKNKPLLEKARKELSETEQQLLAINGRIFTYLQNSLRELKNSEEQDMKVLRDSLLEATNIKFEEMGLLIWMCVGLMLLLAIMIIWNLVKLYKKDVTIIRYANLTADTTKRKGDFMAQMTHEIRTPLNSIIGFSQLIEIEKLDENQRVNVNSIKNASKILLTLVNEILDFSKFESGKITLHDKPFQPAVILNEAVEMLSVLSDEKKIVITSELDLDPGTTLCGDDFRIKQVIINLLTNAIKFTPENGRIWVSSGIEKVAPGKGLLKINVKDSGVGIAKENLTAIFEDFIQVENNDSQSRQVGTGLGLAICKRIVDLYGGQIRAESTPGQGSEFIVRIPLKIAASELRPTAAPVSETAPVEKFLAGKKILIADDTKMNLLLISRFMDKLGADYDMVADGKKAFEMFNEQAYDLVITDIYMPVLNGLELTKQIRGHADKKKAGTPILGFTGGASTENNASYILAGMNDVLPKPFDDNDFKAILKRLLFGEKALTR